MPAVAWKQWRCSRLVGIRDIVGTPRPVALPVMPPHPSPFILHPSPVTCHASNPAPRTPHSSLLTLHPSPSTPSPCRSPRSSSALGPRSPSRSRPLCRSTAPLKLQPSALNSEPCFPDPAPFRLPGTAQGSSSVGARCLRETAASERNSTRDGGGAALVAGRAHGLSSTLLLPGASGGQAVDRSARADAHARTSGVRQPLQTGTVWNWHETQCIAAAPCSGVAAVAWQW